MRLELGHIAGGVVTLRSVWRLNDSRGEIRNAIRQKEACKLCESIWFNTERRNRKKRTRGAHQLRVDLSFRAVAKFPSASIVRLHFLLRRQLSVVTISISSFLPNLRNIQRWQNRLTHIINSINAGLSHTQYERSQRSSLSPLANSHTISY